MFTQPCDDEIITMAHPLDNQPVLKMNGIGNEILVLDLRGSAATVAPRDARAIHSALPYDQLMALHAPRTPGADAAMLIYNNDGSLSGACGNGTRCVAFALARNDGPAQLLLDTDSGPLRSWRVSETVFTVDMGRPRLGWGEIPLARDGGDTRDIVLDPPVVGAPAHFAAANMGNPHAIFFVPDANAVDLATLGSPLEHHPLFPERANISFAQILTRDAIRLRVWERGVGVTRACGSAACACVVAAARAGLTGRRATVTLPGGDLVIDWREDDHVYMTGPVELEFETRLDPRLFEKAEA
jgi:diaminopimelate epimerase